MDEKVLSPAAVGVSRPSEARTTASKSVEAVRKVRKLVGSMYEGARQAKQRGQKVAYCMASCEYEEILAALDIVPVYTENFAGLCAAKRVAQPFIDKADAEGYSQFACSYSRMGLGYEALRKQTGGIPLNSPDGGLVEADLFLGSSWTCDIRFKWFQALGRFRNAPTYPIDILAPPVGRDPDESKDRFVHYVVAELRGLIGFLEEQTGKKLDNERVWELIRRGENVRYWYRKAMALRKAVPCPMGAQDGFRLFVPIFMMPMAPETADFYKGLYEELQERVNHGVGIAKEEEKHRLLWGGGVPPWHSMYILDYFLDRGAVFPFETTYAREFDPIGIPDDIPDPVEAIAHRQYERRTYWQRRAQAAGRDVHPDVERYLDLIDQFHIEGIVFFANRSCRASTVGKMQVGNLVQEHVTVPTLSLVGDLLDMNAFSEDDTKRKIETFIDVLASRKAA